VNNATILSLISTTAFPSMYM